MPDTGVLVVGGGPAGSATATLLARQGHSVTLLDKRRFPRDKACAEYITPGAVDALGRLGALPLPERADATWPLGIRLITPKVSLRLHYPDGTPRTALAIRREVLDTLLLEQAAKAGVDVREGIKVVSPLVERGRVVGVRALEGRNERRFSARVVVGADGAKSVLARSLGLSRPARWPRRLGLVAHYAAGRVSPEYAEMHVGSDSYCGLAAVGDDLAVVGLVVSMSGKRTGENAQGLFARETARLPGVASALRGAVQLGPLRGVGPLANRVHRPAGPGFVLVGDAAGFLDPFTGEGIYRALRGAELAAEAVGRSLQWPSAVPREYIHRRREAFGEKERLCLLIQAFLSWRPALDYALSRLSQRPALSAPLFAALGDYAPAGPLLAPRYLASLLGPHLAVRSRTSLRHRDAGGPAPPLPPMTRTGGV